MAKNFPYFKFIATEWLTGDIVFEEFDVQGLFTNICALYWQRDGKLTIEEINKRYKNPPQLAKLTDRFIFVTDRFITINFLDEQLKDANHISTINSINGSKGGRPKLLKTLKNKPTAKRIKANESELKQSKEEVKKNIIDSTKQSFKNDLAPFLEKYGKEMLNEFYLYWIEPNKSKTKLRFELEKTWDTNLRLMKWASNDKTFKPKKQSLNNSQPVN